jgi:hypothetical protein
MFRHIGLAIGAFFAAIATVIPFVHRHRAPAAQPVAVSTQTVVAAAPPSPVLAEALPTAVPKVSVAAAIETPQAAIDAAAPVALSTPAVEASTPTVEVSTPAADASAAATPSVPPPPPPPTVDQKGLWAMRMSAGVSRPVGTGVVASAGGAGPSLGADASYGLTERLWLDGYYDYLNLKDGIRVQPLGVGPVYMLRPHKRTSAFATAGVGLATISGYPGATGDRTRLGLKLGGGMRYAIDGAIAVDLYLNHHFVPITGYGADLHALAGGIGVVYRFLPDVPAPTP